MTFKFDQAQRSDTKALIGLYGQSGSGKTYSALMLGRGLVGATGKLAMIDTESGRGALYADVIPGGYLRADLGAPFTPQRYIAAIEDAEKAGIECLVIDSMSHEWEGVGGVIEMAGAIEQRTGKPGLHCWKEPKGAHLKMLLKLLGTNMHVICCLRAKRKSRQVTNEKGKQVIVKDEFASPKQDGDFIFEMTVHAEILPDHTMRVTKISHPELASVIRSGERITVETGAKLAAWAKGGAVSTPPVTTPPQQQQPPASDFPGDRPSWQPPASLKVALAAIANMEPLEARVWQTNATAWLATIPPKAADSITAALAERIGPDEPPPADDDERWAA
ncbi:MAG: AAA family ATPase [Alphaproteobacteria bacterium]|nr:AAA family ATPase [Alphaproteobacteria bacterium]MCW5739632.1 AAA family ATPase [Alphaproteobacteria bacterium]